MPDKIAITWSFRAQVAGGPSVSEDKPILEVDAYDQIQALIPAGQSVTVNVQPNSGKFLLLAATPGYDKLSYKVDAGATDITLDGPHILIGQGAVSLLGATQKQFAFKNDGAADVTVHILVGRDAAS